MTWCLNINTFDPLSKKYYEKKITQNRRNFELTKKIAEKILARFGQNLAELAENFDLS